MKIKKLIVNTIWYGIVPKLPSIVMIIILPFITPYLTPRDYGIFGLINSYKGIADAFVGLGLAIHLQNSFFEMPNYYKLLWRRLLFYMLLSSFVVSSLLVFFYMYTLPIVSLLEKIWVVFLAVIPLLFVPNSIVADTYYVLLGNPRIQVPRNVAGALVSVITSFIIIRYLKWGYLGWIIGGALGTLVTFSLFIKPLYIQAQIYPKIDYNWRRIKNLLKVSLPVIPHSFGQVLFSSGDRIIMSLLGVSIADIGLYTNGVQIGGYAYVIISGLFAALSPHLQRIYRSHDRKNIRYYYRLCNILITFFILVGIVGMKEFYNIFIRNTSLHPASYIVILVMISFLLNSTFYHFISASLFIQRKTKKLLYLVFIPSLINVGLNFIFISFWGYIGAAYSTILCNCIMLTYPFIFSFFRYLTQDMLGSRKLVMEGLLINSLALIFAYFAYDSSLLMKLLSVIIFAVFGFIYIRKIKEKKIVLLRQKFYNFAR